LQQVHDYLAKVSCRRSRVTDPAIIPTTDPASIASSSDKGSKCYYDLAFAYRFLYSYVISIAYVTQWVGYWAIFSEILVDVHIYYFLAFSFLSMVAYRIVLNSTLEYYCLCVPFCVVRDTAFDAYCFQWREISLKNVAIFNFDFDLDL
jgi:hypothetical protein